MAKLGCPCGNVIWNGCDGDETTYYFVPLQEITAYWDVMPFFEMTCSPHGVEMWKCDVCDRMMAFDGDSESVTRYLKRVDPETLETEGEAAKGICFNNLFFNEVDRYFTCSSELGECQSYRFFDEAPNREPALTPHVVFEKVLSGKNGRFRNWWLAEMYEGFLVLYSGSDPALRRPVKAWAKYAEDFSAESFDAVGEVADRILDMLEEYPRGVVLTSDGCLSALAERDPDLSVAPRGGFVYKGQQVSFMSSHFDLPTELHVRAIFHGMALNSSIPGDADIGLPGACPFIIEKTGGYGALGQ